MLRRLGKKTRLLPKLLDLFPKDITTFIDMFMGSGTVTVAMVDRAKYIIANDKEDDIFNLFMVLKDHKEELIDAIITMPIHETLFKHWKRELETDSLWRAVRFLMLSNFGVFGKGDTLQFGNVLNKAELLASLRNVFDYLQHVQFMSCDFRTVLPKIHWRHETDTQHGFVYADPPYIGTGNNYCESFTEQDTQDLFALLTGSGLWFAISEFDNPFVLDLAQKYGLTVTILGERRNLKNRRTEILITNYNPIPTQATLF